MQQSAVKWLEDQIKSKHWKEMFIWQKEEVFKKAKKMFEEQINNAHYEGSENYRRQYYKETFKSG